jgi:hypothetical protein
MGERTGRLAGFHKIKKAAFGKGPPQKLYANGQAPFYRNRKRNGGQTGKVGAAGIEVGGLLRKG